MQVSKVNKDGDKTFLFLVEIRWHSLAYPYCGFRTHSPVFAEGYQLRHSLFQEPGHVDVICLGLTKTDNQTLNASRSGSDTDSVQTWPGFWDGKRGSRKQKFGIFRSPWGHIGRLSM